MTPLEQALHTDILTNGPLSLHDYFNLCLYHNDHGYYFNRNPIGHTGDFITAPEISPLFGKSIAMAIIEADSHLHNDKPINIVELGPGLGTLTQDMAHTFSHIPYYHNKVHYHLVEASPYLSAYQQERLQGLNAQWTNELQHLSLTDGPVYIVANEFFDALAINQYLLEDGVLYQKQVTRENGALTFTWQPIPWPRHLPIDEGEIYEDRPLQNEIVASLTNLLKQHHGALIAIDYGYTGYGGQDTLQAVQHHTYVSPLHQPGLTDLTSHINFTELAKQVEAQGAYVNMQTEQGEFLQRLGIEFQLQKLSVRGCPQAYKNHKQAVERLISLKAMGSLFKVLVASYPQIPPLKGVF